MKKWQIAVIVAAVGVATYYAVDLFKSDRQRVSDLVGRLASRLAKRDGPGFCSLLAEDYHDQHPHGSRGDVRTTLAIWMPMIQSLSIDIEDLRVELSGGKGTAEFLARVEVRPNARSADPQRGSSRVKLYVRKVDGEWLVGEAEYQFPGQLRALD